MAKMNSKFVQNLVKVLNLVPTYLHFSDIECRFLGKLKHVAIRGIIESCFLKQSGCQREMFTTPHTTTISKQIITFVENFVSS